MDKEEMEETMTKIAVSAIWDAVLGIVIAVGLIVLVLALVNFIKTEDKQLLIIISLCLPCLSLLIIQVIKYKKGDK